MALNPADYAQAGTEHAHQVALFMWAQQNAATVPELRLMFAIPNGGERNRAVAGRLKAEGVKPGVPDIFLPVPRGSYAGLFIELKRPASEHGGAGVLSELQAKWLAELLEQRYAAIAVWGWQAASERIISYLNVGMDI